MQLSFKSTIRTLLIWLSVIQWDLKNLMGLPFQISLESFLSGVPTEGWVTREELFLDLLQIVLDSADEKADCTFFQ